MTTELGDGLPSSSEKGDIEEVELHPSLDDSNLDPDSAVTGVLDDDSPYPEVRSAVANTDDPSIPASSIRVWLVGIIMTILFSGLNQFFFFRYPSLSINGFVVVLISLPIGRAWATVVPKWRIFGISLNPGPFSIKEHVLVTTMASVSLYSAYATDVVAVQRVYFNQTYSFIYQWMLVMSTQLLGFSMGGILRRFLVQPPTMIWPGTLVSCALFNTLHGTSYAGMGTRGGISRARFFLYLWAVGVLWYFFPGYLFQALSYFSWVCWIAPENIVVNQLFGYVSGLGMSLITFDWAQISYIGSPLVAPWWAQVNIAVGFVFFIWILTPALYYTNTWYSQYMPMSSRTSYDNTGKPFNVTRIINADASLNVIAYQHYSPIFLPLTFAMSYGLAFAAITATLMHAILYFRKQIWTQAKRSIHEQPDIHARLMSKYEQIPEWWYGIIFVLTTILGITVIELWHVELPLWGFFLSFVIAFFYAIPTGMILALTNQVIGLYVITELIIGYAFPGHPIALMLFKSWGTVALSHALQFSADFKLGHYMKVPPRPMFWCQIIATIVAGTVQLGVQAWMFTNIPSMCSPEQKDGFICPNTEVLGTATFVWGVVSPIRVFSPGQVYGGLTYFFLVGALCPLIAYLISRKWPNSFIRYVNFPVMFNGVGSIPPASAVNYVTWAIVGFVFNYYIRRKHFSWWAKYNYVLSAALDSGVAFSIIIIFFALEYPKNGKIGETTVQTWWGNMIFRDTADGKGLPLKTLPAGSKFGPATW